MYLCNSKLLLLVRSVCSCVLYNIFINLNFNLFYLLTDFIDYQALLVHGLCD